MEEPLRGREERGAHLGDIGTASSRLRVVSMKKVLFIAYFFPPLGGSGVQRSLKFAKYLPDFGWQPTVLTQQGSGFKKDHSMLEELPLGLEVTRAFSLETSNLISPLAKIGIVKSSRAPFNIGSATAGSAQSSSKPFNLYGGFSKIKETLLKYVLVPDGNIGWLPGCYLAGRRLLKTGRYDAMITTSSPYTAHLIGALLRQRFDIPWIADFRDEWTNNPLLQEIISHRRRTHEWMERQVLERADAVVAVSKESCKNFQKMGPPGAESKFHAIYNGYDDRDFRGLAKRASSRQFILSHVGTLAGNRQADDLWLALDELAKIDSKAASAVQINIIGSTDKIVDFPKTTLDLGSKVRMAGHMPHLKAIEKMFNSDALLLVVAKEMGRQGLSGKVFEYMAVGRPIIGIVPKESEAARIINETRSGVVIQNGEPKSLAKAIGTFVNKWKKGERLIDQRREEVEKYTRRHLTSQLAAILDRLTSLE